MYNNKPHNPTSSESEGSDDTEATRNDISADIESMQEEPVNEDLEDFRLYWRFWIVYILGVILYSQWIANLKCLYNLVWAIVVCSR